MSAGGAAAAKGSLVVRNVGTIVTGDLDANGLTDIVLDLGAAGLWSFSNATTWQQLSPYDAATLAVGRFH